MCLAVAVVVAVLTRWPVAAALSAVGVWVLPAVIGPNRDHARRVARIEAIATWTEALRDSLSGAAGLEQAITTSAIESPEPIRDEVNRLATRLQHGWRLPAALRAFAAELADPTADLVVAGLLMAARGSAGQLGDVLGELAASARAKVASRQRIAAGRNRTSARVIVGVTLAMVGILTLINRGYRHRSTPPQGSLSSCWPADVSGSRSYGSRTSCVTGTRVGFCRASQIRLGLRRWCRDDQDPAVRRRHWPVAVAVAVAVAHRHRLRAAYAELRYALTEARLARVPPWDILAVLGQRLAVAELQQLAATVGMAGTEGARVRSSLRSRAIAMRERQFTDAEGAANAATERMILPIVALFGGFLIFLGYPALAAVLGGLQNVPRVHEFRSAVMPELKGGMQLCGDPSPWVHALLVKR